MDLSEFKNLFTDTGREGLAAAVARAPREQDYLAHFQSLSKAYPPEIARPALETAILRIEARKKFGERADRMYFTREALEQATSLEVAAYRSARFARYDRILDLGCSIGGDTIPLRGVANKWGATGNQVIGLDKDELRLAMARANLGALELSAQFILADLNHPIPLAPGPRTALFFDPARRSDHRRVYSIKDYQPPLEIVHKWMAQHLAIGVKISPGVKLDELNGLDCEIEFISLNGELKEAVLWFGPLKQAGMRATVLPGGQTLTSERFLGEDAGSPVSPPLAYLYEPDPAVIRAGLVTTLGEMLDANQLDSSIAYLTSDKRVETPFARSWPIEDWLPFNLKKLRTYLRGRNIGKVTVKKRGSAITPEKLIADLKLKKGDEEKILVLTRLNGAPIVLVLGG